MWTQIDIINVGKEANDGVAVGQAAGDLVSLFLATLLWAVILFNGESKQIYSQSIQLFIKTS